MNDLLGRLLPHSKLSDSSWKQELAHQYARAQPYPHICLDDFFDGDVLRRVVQDFPLPEQLGIRFEDVREVKRASATEYEIPPFPRVFIHALNSAPFIGFLEEVTGISGLIADPYLLGGGFHSLPPGGKLSIHTDFNYHKKLRLDRRVNVLVYLNENWPEAFGGHFEAWRPRGSQAEARYLPIFNRLVVFTTTDFTFHGNPDPVACPEGTSRKSIAMYYYSNGRPKDEWDGLMQTTRFMNRPGEAIAQRDPTWYRIAHLAPRPLREWFTRHIHRKRQTLAP
jgi:Rps23 Pro-64 3,4-dihydroxylase Tpa1-like proline 4-hydroxylase